MKVGLDDPELCRLLEENATDLVTLYDLDGRRVYASPSCERLLGPLRQVTFCGVHPDDGDFVIASWKQIVLGNRASATFRHRAANGGYVWLEAAGCLVTFRDAPHILAITRDVTERVDAERARRTAEARFRAFIDNASDALFLLDGKAAILDVNREACTSLGYTREELVGMTPFDFDADATVEGVEFIARRLERGEVVELQRRHRRKDGSVFPVAVRLRSFELDGERNTIAISRDLTNVKRTERQVAKLEEQFRQVIVKLLGQVGGDGR